MVLLPDLRAGCSLAESVTAEALAERKAELREIYPDLKVVSYVNCTADVKARVRRLLHLGQRGSRWSKRSTPSTSCSFPIRTSPTTCRPRPQEDHLMGRQLLRASSDHPRGGRARSNARFPGSRCWRIRSAAKDVLRARRRGALDQRDGALCRKQRRRQVPDRDRVRTVGSPADGDSREALLQGVQALPLHEDDHARRHARFACATCATRSSFPKMCARARRRALERMLELGA